MFVVAFQPLCLFAGHRATVDKKVVRGLDPDTLGLGWITK